jgi:GAF domain-containing protein
VVHPPVPGAGVLLSGEPASAELSSWLDAIAEITRAANRSAPLDELLDLIAGATAHLTGYDFCAVFVADAERRALIIAGSYGLSQEYIDTINARTPILLRAGDTGEGPSSRAFRSQRPTTVLDIAADPPSRSWETVAAHQGYSSLLAVPLVVAQEPFGLINCYTAEKHQFSAREIILMESMANQAGLAIETTRRLSDAREQAERASAAVVSLQADLEAQQQADRDHQELLGVVLRGGGLAAIAESLAAKLRCTVAIDDAAGRLLASAGSSGRSGSRRRPGTCGRCNRRRRSGRRNVRRSPGPPPSSRWRCSRSARLRRSSGDSPATSSTTSSTPRSGPQRRCTAAPASWGPTSPGRTPCW